MSNSHWLMIEVAESVTVQFHMLLMLYYRQSNQPNEVNQQEWPISWNQKELKHSATQRHQRYCEQIFPQVKFVQRTQYRTIALYTMQCLLGFLNKQAVLKSVFVRIGQPRRGEILNNQVYYVETHEVHESKVFIVKNAVDYVCVEEGEISPALSTVYGSMIQYCLCFPKRKAPIGETLMQEARMICGVHTIMKRNIIYRY